MFGFDAFLLFMAGALALNLTPGPDVAFVLAQSAGRGTRAGLTAALGIGAGACVHVSLAVCGLSALLMASPLLFDILRYAGAAYLVWIAIGMLRQPPHLTHAKPEAAQGAAKTFRQGMLTNIANPKVALFFMAYLPQFVVPGPNAWLQFLLLGLAFTISGTIVTCLYALGGGALTAGLKRNPIAGKVMSWLSASVMFALALRLAVTERR